MAIIYSYPEKTTPSGNDFLVITDSEQLAPNKNRTKSLKIDNLADYIVTSTPGNITGSGTLNTIAMFTPDGSSIGDSLITQPTPGVIFVSANLTVEDDAQFENNLIADTIEISNGLTVYGNSFFDGDATFEYSVNINNELYDSVASSGIAGQVLTSTGTGIEWKSYSESGATFLGWARYDGAASFSNGSEVTVTDGNFIDPPVSLVTNQIIDPYVNGLVGKFLFTNDDLNAVYSLTVVFKASAANANQTHVDVDFISGATDYERLSKSCGFYKGNNTVQNFHEMYQFYVDSDLITYGLQPRLYADGGTVKFGDVIFFIQKQQQPAI